MRQKRVIIMGAAGRDFHNFNVYFRDNKDYKVVAFTATQIPDIEDRMYPAQLAGSLYKKGIQIYPESRLAELVGTHNVDQVVHAYSDVSHTNVMHAASIAMAAGADFRLMGPGTTYLKSRKPVVAVCAVRTGAGKSPTSQFIVDYLMQQGLRVGVIRHPMPYGDLVAMEVQRFAKYEDFETHKSTIEEREEYEPYVRRGVVIWAGVDYLKILRRAEKEADVILWDGGNNDIPFYAPDLYITVVDPHRAGHEMNYHPGEANLRAANVLLISKTGTAPAAGIDAVKKSIRAANPKARVFRTDLTITAVDNESIKDKKVIVVEDGPTLTHGEMAYGAGAIFAKKQGAKMVRPAKYAVGSIRKVYEKFPHLKNILPAMGYGAKQIREFETTINKAKADIVLGATPVDLSQLIKINKPLVQVRYALKAPAAFKQLLTDFAKQAKAKKKKKK